jgi:OOP family OmpA-OmpF porin
VRGLLIAVSAATFAASVSADVPSPWRETPPVHVEPRAPGAWRAPVAPWGQGEPFMQRVEGWVESRAWRLEIGETSGGVVAEVARAMKDDGWSEIFSCVAEACGGFDFRAALQTPPPPALRLDLLDYAAASFRRNDEWAVVIASRAGASVGMVLTTIAQPDDDGAFRAAAGAAAETAAAPVGLKPPAEDIGAILDAQGYAILRGLEFEVGALRFSPGANETLDRAAEALAARPGLRVAVVGHTDGAGALDVNLRVSGERARLVMQALVERGVAASRMEAHGAGWLAPLASNDTEEGRALNRRVELVAR